MHSTTAWQTLSHPVEMRRGIIKAQWQAGRYAGRQADRQGCKKAEVHRQVSKQPDAQKSSFANKRLREKAAPGGAR